MKKKTFKTIGVAELNTARGASTLSLGPIRYNAPITYAPTQYNQYQATGTMQAGGQGSWVGPLPPPPAPQPT
jgi:hypothetical protein